MSLIRSKVFDVLKSILFWQKFLTFVAKHSVPPTFTDALQASVAVAIDTARKTDTLVAKRSGPGKFSRSN